MTGCVILIYVNFRARHTSGSPLYVVADPRTESISERDVDGPQLAVPTRTCDRYR